MILSKTDSDSDFSHYVLHYFQLKPGIKEDFFFKMEIRENKLEVLIRQRINQKRHTCVEFGDVVVFNVTYKTNSFNISLTPFTGA